MLLLQRILLIAIIFINGISLQAQNYKAERLKKAAVALGLQVVPDSLLPEKIVELTAKDGRKVYLRTDPMGNVEQVGLPLFSSAMRFLQPSPIYDFLEYAVLNWKYKILPNQLYLSKVIFKKGGWEILASENLQDCECSIENREDKLYVVTWRKENKDVAVIGIPIEYELLNNDTRRNMESGFINDLLEYKPRISRPQSPFVQEKDLNIYGTEGLFVVPGKSYIISLLNQNIYYKLTTVTETTDTVINNKPVRMTLDAVLPVVVNDTLFPAESFANMMICDDLSVPDITINLDFHLSNYHHRKISMPLSQLKSFCRQNGCEMYFACDIVKDGNARGIMFASNLPKGYNHLFSLRTTTEQLAHDIPTIKANVYLYTPPVNKEKLLGTAPVKKSGAQFKLP